MEQNSECALIGEYSNQMGSHFKLQTAANGSIRGQYSTGVGSPEPVQWFDAAGTYTLIKDGYYVISWTVNYGKFNSIATWNGVADTKKNATKKEVVIHTNWLLNSLSPKEIDDNVGKPLEMLYIMKTSRTGSNTFTFTKPA